MTVGYYSLMVRYAFVMLPLVVVYYVVIGVLEDSGFRGG